MFYRSPFLALFLVIILAACGASTAKSEAEALAERYFSAAERGAFEEILPLYADVFYKATP